MEALRTRLDSLNWEVQRLEVKNRRLREEDPARVDREAELEKARADVAEMEKRIETLEQQLAESAGATTEAGHRASEAEERVAELSERIDELSAANQCHGMTAGGGTPDRATGTQLEEALRASEDRMQQLEAELTLAEEARGAVAAEREAVQERAELERYRALEDERRRWDARESRLYARLEAAEEELRAAKATAADAEDDEPLREKLRTLTSDLDAVQALVSSLSAENSRLVQQNERLGRENLSAQERQFRLARSQLDQEEWRVGSDRGHGTRAQLTTTTARLGRENLPIHKQRTALAQSQPDCDQRWTATDREYRAGAVVGEGDERGTDGGP